MNDTPDPSGPAGLDPAEVPVEDPRPDGLRSVKSLVLVNTGDGKGKTSAALGVVLRGLAQGWPVAVVQFLKSDDWKTGEQKICTQLGVDWWAIGEGFTWDSANLEKDKATASVAWNQAKSAIESGNYRLVVLDEITYPLNWNWIETADVVATIKARPEHTSVILTGRNAPEAIIEVADTVSEIRSVKHAYDSGIAAKKGIDY